MNPFRKVVKCSLLSEKKRLWVLDLECGHQVERPLTYHPAKAAAKLTHGGARYRGPVRPMSEAKEPPQRVRCECCGDAIIPRLGARDTLAMSHV